MDYHTFRAPLNATDRLLLDAAAAQHRERGYHRVADLAAAAGVTPDKASHRIGRMRRLGLWPHGKAGSEPRRRPDGVPRYEVTGGDVAWALAVGRKAARKIPNLADECESAALVGLAEAAGAFDPSRRGVPFRAYALPRVRGAVSDFLRREYPRGYGRSWAKSHPGEAAPATGSLDAPVPGSGRGQRGDPLPLSEFLGAQPAVDTPDEHAEAVRDLARRLPRHYRCVFRTVHELGVGSGAEVAERLGLSESRVYQVLGQSYARLRERFPDAEALALAGRSLPHRAG